jgi:hypothetical protein
MFYIKRPVLTNSKEETELLSIDEKAELIIRKAKQRL